MAKLSCIYKIVNSINDKIYIGSTLYFNNRKGQHRTALKYSRHTNKKLQNFVNKYGIGAISFAVVEVVNDPTELLSREQHYIDTLNPWFNVSPTAGTCVGKKHSEETKRNMKGRPGRRGIKNTEEGRKNCSLAQKERFKNPVQLAIIRGNGVKKVTDQQVIEIREKYIPFVYTTTRLAEEYGISQQNVSRIINFKRRQLAIAC